MFLFLRLVLAHLLADFPFQTSFIFKKKFESLSGVVLHAFVFLVWAYALGFVYIKSIYFHIAVGIMFVAHIVIDAAKVHITKKYGYDNTTMFFVDQFLHIAVKTVVFLFPFKIPSLQEYLTSSKLLNFFIASYFDDKVIIYLIGYVISIFVTTILVLYVRKGIRPEINIARGVLSLKTTSYAVFERFLITTCTIIGREAMILILILVLNRLRMIVLRKRGDEKYYGYDFDDLIVSVGVAFVVGIMLKYFVYDPASGGVLR